MGIKKILNKPNPWLVGIGSPVIVSAVSYSVAKVAGWDIDNLLKQIYESTLNFLAGVFHFNIQLWVIALIVIGIILLRILILKIHKNSSINNSTQEDDLPDFINYTSGVFAGQLKWTWGYSKSSVNGQYDIVDLSPLCERCGTTLTIKHFMSSLDASCPRCKAAFFMRTFYNDHDQFYLDAPNDVVAVIIDNIKRNKYKSENQE